MRCERRVRSAGSKPTGRCGARPGSTSRREHGRTVRRRGRLRRAALVRSPGRCGLAVRRRDRRPGGARRPLRRLRVGDPPALHRPAVRQRVEPDQPRPAAARDRAGARRARRPGRADRDHRAWSPGRRSAPWPTSGGRSAPISTWRSTSWRESAADAGVDESTAAHVADEVSEGVANGRRLARRRRRPRAAGRRQRRGDVAAGPPRRLLLHEGRRVDVALDGADGRGIRRPRRPDRPAHLDDRSPGTSSARRRSPRSTPRSSPSARSCSACRMSAPSPCSRSSVRSCRTSAPRSPVPSPCSWRSAMAA